jgi:hypothetical protein
MSVLEPIFPCVPAPPDAPVVETPVAETPVAEATQVIETVGVEVLEKTPDAVLVEVLENTPDAVLDDLKKTAHANDVIPFASTLPRVG